MMGPDVSGGRLPREGPDHPRLAQAHSRACGDAHPPRHSLKERGEPMPGDARAVTVVHHRLRPIPG
jgi:hypothetical protein